MVESTTLLASVIPAALVCVGTLVAAFITLYIFLKTPKRDGLNNDQPAATNNGQAAGSETNTGQSSSEGQANNGQTTDEGQSSSGRHVLSARDLEIEHADKTKDTEYWEWIDDPSDRRFKEALKLKYVYLLDITARRNFRNLTSKTIYAAYLIFRTTPKSVNLDTIQKAWVSVGGVKVDNDNHDNVCIKPKEGTVYNGPIELPVERDGWMELKLGEFYCDIANDVDVEITIKETNTARQNTKTGLIVAAIEVRPAQTAKHVAFIKFLGCLCGRRT